MSSAFVRAGDLRRELDGPNPPIVLDASFILHRPVFDGDYRSESGRRIWLAGHVPGSHHVDISTRFSDASRAQHFAHPDPRSIARELAVLGVAQRTPVVVYDASGTLWAARLWYLLRWVGVDVRVLDGGLGAWRAAGFAVEEGDAPAPASVPEWRPRAVRDAWITREQLRDREASDARPLVCALASGQFTGRDTTRYSRRGRIPGSVNVPSRSLFHTDGTLRERDAIRDAYAAAGVTGDEGVLLYCGGGISAAASALTLEEIGISAVRIYDGSLEEWSADPSLPLVTG
jgi:thiosulfate/3-mercaptopyruvate sulfurtransferase